MVAAVAVSRIIGVSPYLIAPRRCRYAESVPNGTTIGVTTASGCRFKIAARIALYKGVSVLLTPGSGAMLTISTVTLGSLIRAFMSEMNSSVLVPGSTRQSNPASLVDGITFTLGGDPTPA